jgi:hypothetical protein
MSDTSESSHIAPDAKLSLSVEIHDLVNRHGSTIGDVRNRGTKK